MLLIIPCSSLCFFSHSTEPQFSLHYHGSVSFMDFSASSTIRLTLLTAPSSFRGRSHLLFKCNCVSSHTDHANEMGFLFSFFREIGLNEEETELLLLKNPAIKITPLDNIRSRVLSLRSLKLSSLAIYHLVTKCPNLLTAEEIDSLISFLLDNLGGRLEPAQVERLLSATDIRFLSGFDQKVKLLLHHGVPKEKIAHVLNNVNLTKLCKKSIADIERMIGFFEPFGGIGIIVRRPAILNSDLDSQLIPRVNFLRDVSGKDDYATGAVLHKLPAILTYSVEHMESHVEFLKSFARLSNHQVFKVIHVFPSVISASKDRKLRPRIEFLMECGLDSHDIFKLLTKAPLFLALSEDNLAKKLGFLVKIGHEHKTKELAMAMGAVTRTSCENMQKVIGLYVSYGLSFTDILAMSKKHPQVLQYNHSSLEEKMEYLIEEMGRDVEELLVFPAFLGYKLDGRIKQRYEVKKKIRGENMSLNKLLTVSAKTFSVKKKSGTLVHD